METPAGNLIYFIYGLAFILMGLSIAVQPRLESDFALARPLPFLAAFGILHGVHEWMEVWHVDEGSPAARQTAAGFLAVSFLPLQEFGRRLVRLSSPAAGRWQRVAEWCTHPIWYLPVALLLAQLALNFEPHDFAVATRYLLAFPGALTSAIGLLLYYRSEADRLHPMGLKRYFYSAAGGFAGYAVAAGLLVPPADFFPANRYSSEYFFDAAEDSVVGLRTLFAIVAAVSLGLILRMFRAEVRLGVERAIEHASHCLSELTEVTQRHEQILRIAGSGLVGINRKGRCVFANPTTLEVLGFPEAELIGRPCTEVIRCYDAKGELKNCPFCEALRTRKPTHRSEMLFIRRDGTSVPVEFVAEPVDEPGELDGGLVLSFIDISQRWKAEQRLRYTTSSLQEKTRKLERANADLEQYAYIAAHDLKAPIRAVSMLVTVIEEDFQHRDPQSLSKHAGLLRERVTRMDRLINDLLRYARAGSVNDPPEPVDTRAMVHELIHFLALPSSFRIEVDAAMPSLVTWRTPLSQIFANLLGNAVAHHDRENGHIRVTAHPCGKFYEFEVSDDGPGIREEHRETILQVFQVLNPGEGTQHSGLGLALVKKLVESHEGELFVESGESRGATFRFTWPVAANSLADAVPPADNRSQRISEV
ncbi:sensor histidine kinase [Thiohalomonas denitrificans]|uniref:histidine kinase n=1 Tax=Thiohalomonas denitrificans TaxID=415747 RepID=A0A1G5PLN3_9GAMM|nr:ATP-binding protein [Thiohalomonas denitrificans]SCZ49969.1 PAS domain S-box-containing protein [Thiohalomonas denitrificans]